MLRTAIRQWRTWADDGIQIDLALNLTAADLELPTLADEITETLQGHEMPADRLVLEITERTTLRERREVQRSLQRLTELAVCLSIDDYGIGFSSLDALRRLPVRQLKIDRRFVHGIPGDTKNLEIVRSTIELAHNLGATVVAEGVKPDRSSPSSSSAAATWPLVNP